MKTKHSIDQYKHMRIKPATDRPTNVGPSPQNIGLYTI